MKQKNQKLRSNLNLMVLWSPFPNGTKTSGTLWDKSTTRPWISRKRRHWLSFIVNDKRTLSIEKSAIKSETQLSWQWMSTSMDSYNWTNTKNSAAASVKIFRKELEFKYRSWTKSIWRLPGESTNLMVKVELPEKISRKRCLLMPF